MINELSDFKKLVGSKIFTVRFIKKDNTIRTMNCRLGVTKHLKGGELAYDAASLNYLTVYDLQAKAYRTINVNTLLTLTVDKMRYEVEDGHLIGSNEA